MGRMGFPMDGTLNILKLLELLGSEGFVCHAATTRGSQVRVL